MACDNCKRLGKVSSLYLVLAEETSNSTITHNNTKTTTKTNRKLETVYVHYCLKCFFKHFVKYVSRGLVAGFVSVGLIVLTYLDGKYKIDIPLLLRVAFILIAIYIGIFALSLLFNSLSSVDCCEKILKSIGKLESIHNYKVCLFKSDNWDKMQKKLAL